jgi:hypothetical protein
MEVRKLQITSFPGTGIRCSEDLNSKVFGTSDAGNKLFKYSGPIETIIWNSHLFISV